MNADAKCRRVTSDFKSARNSFGPSTM